MTSLNEIEQGIDMLVPTIGGWTFASYLSETTTVILPSLQSNDRDKNDEFERNRTGYRYVSTHDWWVDPVSYLSETTTVILPVISG